MNSQDLWIGSIFHPFHGNDPGAGWFISGGWPERAAAHLLDFYGSSCIVFAAETLVCFSVQPASLLSWLTPQSCLPLKFALPNVLSDKECHRQHWTCRSWSVIGDKQVLNVTLQNMHLGLLFKPSLCPSHQADYLNIFISPSYLPHPSRITWWPGHLSELREALMHGDCCSVIQGPYVIYF